MTPDEIRSKNMIDAAIAEAFKQQQKPASPTAEQDCINRANEVVLRAKRRFVHQIQLLPMRPSRNEATELIYEIFYQEFKGWSSNDFKILACMVLAMQAVESLRDDLA